MKKKQFDDLFP